MHTYQKKKKRKEKEATISLSRQRNYLKSYLWRDPRLGG